MQTAGADILRAFIHAEGEVRDFFLSFAGKFQFHAFSLEQCHVLLDQGRLGFRQNADEVFHGKRLQFDTNRKASLQFRNQVAAVSKRGMRPRR